MAGYKVLMHPFPWRAMGRSHRESGLERLFGLNRIQFNLSLHGESTLLQLSNGLWSSSSQPAPEFSSVSFLQIYSFLSSRFCSQHGVTPFVLSRRLISNNYLLFSRLPSQTHIANTLNTKENPNIRSSIGAPAIRRPIIAAGLYITILR